VALAAWGVAGLRLPSWPAWVVVGIFAVVSVAGTHDFLVFQESTWNLAAATNRAGVDIHVVQRLLGHTHIASTVGYTHLAIDDLRDAVANIWGAA